MEKLKFLRWRKENRVDFVKYLVDTLLSGNELYTDTLMFKEALDEMHRILREEIFENGKYDLIEAYEIATVLRAVVGEDTVEPRRLLLELKRHLGR